MERMFQTWPRTMVVGCVVLAAGSVLTHSRAGASVAAERLLTKTVTGPGSESHATTACSPSLLFQAAIAKEHFSPSAVPSGPRVSVQECDGGWAVALVSRPNVGMTDGFTLFRWRRGRWTEDTQLPNGAVECNLEAEGIAAPLSAELADGYRGTAVAGCTTPKHGVATTKCNQAYRSLLSHLPYQTANVEISAENAAKEVVLVVKMELSPSDMSDESAAISTYKRNVAAYMKTYGVNPADYVVRYFVIAPHQ